MTPRAQRIADVCALALRVYPFLMAGWLYAGWLVAWIVLGHEPVPYVDDPKGLGLPVMVPLTAHGILMLAAPVALPAGLGFAPYRAAKAARRRGRSKTAAVVTTLLTVAGAWALTFWLYRSDPQRVVDWWMD